MHSKNSLLKKIKHPTKLGECEYPEWIEIFFLPNMKVLETHLPVSKEPS